MIYKGSICVRTKNGYGRYFGMPKGIIFKVYKSHPTNAFYSHNGALPPGFFTLANPEEIKAYNKGIRNIKDINYTTTIKSLDNLSNDIKAIEKHKTPKHEKMEMKKTDGRKNPKKKGFKKWTKEDIILLVGYCKGAETYPIGYRKAAEVMSRSVGSTAQMWNRIKDPSYNLLKRFGLNKKSFIAIPALPTDLMTPPPGLTNSKIDNVDNTGVQDSFSSKVIISVGDTSEPTSKQSLALETMKLLSSKLTDDEKIKLVDYMIK